MTKENAVRIIVLGESGVGKTSLLLRFVKGIFKANTSNTLVDLYNVEHEVDGRKLNLELWDTAGQDRFKAIVRNYFRKADGVLLVYDVTNITSFLKLSSWLAELRQTNETATAIIVGNKKDDPDTQCVSLKSVREFANEENMQFFEASAKKDENVKHIFEFLTRSIVKSKDILIGNPTSSPSSTTTFTDVQPNSFSPTEEPPIDGGTIFVNTMNGRTESESSDKSWTLVPRQTEDVIKLDDNPSKTTKKKKKCC